MSLFKSLKGAFSGNVNKFSGRKDFLEAGAAAAARVAGADGDIADSELDKALKSLTSIESIKVNFSQTEIEQCLDRMVNRANGGRVGRNGLMKEIEDVKGDADMAEQVLLVALDVADDNGIGDDEMKVLNQIASTLGLSLQKYL